MIELPSIFLLVTMILGLVAFATAMKFVTINPKKIMMLIQRKSCNNCQHSIFKYTRYGESRYVCDICVRERFDRVEGIQAAEQRNCRFAYGSRKCKFQPYEEE